MRRDPDGALVLSRKNISALLAKLDGYPPGSALTIKRGPDVVRAEEDRLHYGNREPGGMHPETERAIWRSPRLLHHDRLYVNLSAGVEWLPILAPEDLARVRLIRISSTLCEQHHHDQLLHELDADLIASLALGLRCLVLDAWSRSGSPRGSRACWRGLEIVKYALHRSWGLREYEPLLAVETPLPYLRAIWEETSRSTRNRLASIGRLRDPGLDRVRLESRCIRSTMDGRHDEIRAVAAPLLRGCQRR